MITVTRPATGNYRLTVQTARGWFGITPFENLVRAGLFGLGMTEDGRLSFTAANADLPVHVIGLRIEKHGKHNIWEVAFEWRRDAVTEEEPR